MLYMYLFVMGLVMVLCFFVEVLPAQKKGERCTRADCWGGGGMLNWAYALCPWCREGT